MGHVTRRGGLERRRAMGKFPPVSAFARSPVPPLLYPVGFVQGRWGWFFD